MHLHKGYDQEIYRLLHIPSLHFQPKMQTKLHTSSRLLLVFQISVSLFLVYLTMSIFTLLPVKNGLLSSREDPDLSLNHIVFGVFATQASWPKTKDFIELWWRPSTMKGCVFLDSPLPDSLNNTILPLCISEDTSNFRYFHPSGLRSAIRCARVVLETVALGHGDVRWYVFGDEDTVFFPDNLVKTLSKYDDKLWYYIGSSSENVEQNRAFGFEMGLTGAGFAISFPLAKVLAKVLDSCLERHPHLYGGDARVHSCIAELGVGLTHEPGFHQFDIRGDASGLLSSHPVTPLVSIHNLDFIDPIFPYKTTLQALKHLHTAVNIDTHRILQQTICYDVWFSWTILVSWGYAVQVVPRHLSLPEALGAYETFRPWKNGNPYTEAYMFDTKRLDPDLCKRPTIFFLDEVRGHVDGDRVETTYKKLYNNCSSQVDFEVVRVYSQRMNLKMEQLLAPRRHCCDMLRSSNNKVLDIAVRECKEEEQIYMRPHL